MSLLKVTVKNATKLPNLKDEEGYIDPYVAVKFRGQEKCTEILDDTLTPEWNTTLEWILKSPLTPNEEIVLKIYDKMSLNRKREIGTLNYGVGELLDQEPLRESLRLKPSHKDIKKEEWEKVRLNVEFHYQMKSISTVKNLFNTPSSFQIRVYVFKGRLLEGNHVSPVITVTCNRQSQSTVKKSLTNAPVYNELKTFYFKTTSADLFSEDIQIHVRDLDSANSSTVGYFSINIGSVYEETDHTIFGKWLVLSDPNDSMAGVKGFLNVSMSVTGPNDDPVFLTNDESTRDLDIESNILRSPNVKLQQATLRVRLYHAKDIPQVDPSSIGEAVKTVFTGKKTLHSADPYAIVTFDGQSEQTSVKNGSQNPEWNEQINLGFHFPSICDKIVLQIKDKDGFFSADDYVGTCFISIPEIAVHGRNGFLPSFGPSYVNLYGSPQDFSFFRDKYDDMNKGMLEGVAYRGRVLLEVDTQLGGDSKNAFQSIDTEAQQTLKRYVSGEEEYALCAVFNGASMIKDASNDMRFEVSIGTHSQKINVQEMKKDGPLYCSVNWGNKKPLVEVFSKWEDCLDRIYTLNILVNHLNDLEQCFAKFEKMEKTTQQFHQLNHQFQENIKLCHSTLSKLHDKPNYTKLDRNLRQHRLNELSDILLTAGSLSTGSPSDLHRVYERLAVLLKRFKLLAADPQISIPDVIVWLLDKKTRVGYCRIPASTIMYSPVSVMTGRMCGKLQTLQLKVPCVSTKPSGSDPHSCFVEVSLSLGPQDHKDVFLQNSLHTVYGNSLKVDQTQRVILGENSSKYELRAYIHQARDLVGADPISGLSDPYCTVSFCGATSATRVVTATLSPKWCQTVTLKGIEQYAKLDLSEDCVKSPFTVAVKLFDKDKFGSDDYLGTVVTEPVVRESSQSPLAVLQWHAITRFDGSAGELLSAFELIKMDQPDFTPEVLDGDTIPDRFLPPTVLKTIKVQCLGVRQMQEHKYFPVDHPFIKVQCLEEVRTTGVLKKGMSMFPNRNLEMEMNIPEGEIFSPPLKIFVYDKRMFGYTPMIGCESITSLSQFENKNIDGKQLYRIANPITQPDGKIQGSVTHDSAFDWWSKYYASIGDESKVQDNYPNGAAHRLTIFPSELEVPFQQFSDTVKTYPLFSGVGKQTIETASPVGYFRGVVSVHDKGLEPNITSIPPGIEDGIPDIYPLELLVRVYVVKGMNLKPLDPFTGKSDPYIEVSAGKQKKSSVDNFIPNDCNPIFGQVFELNATLPDDHKLTVAVKDHDYLTGDDTIGSTTIDLEDRFFSSHRALIGIPRNFSVSGLNSWRDFLTPVDVLSNFCSIHGLSINWSDDRRTVQVNGHPYHLGDVEEAGIAADGNEQHRLAVHVLHQLELVPEHVETRTLYRDNNPTIPQGQLHMWVDIIPKVQKGAGILLPPPVVDITPRKPLKYVLRVVVWGVADVTSSGDQLTSDFFVTSILKSGKTQKTDTHYFAFGGEGQFNWRFVYPFDYDPIAKKIVYKEKDHFYSLDSTAHCVEDSIAFQLWDNDFFSSNDFLGKVEFSLCNAPRPVSRKSQCGLQTLDNRIDLFKSRINSTLKGWLPIYKGQGEERQCTGKLNVWLEMLTEEEARLRPAGIGREEPNQYPELQKPDRPLLKFNFFDSAMKTFRFSIWRSHKCLVVFGTFCLVILVIGLLIL